MKRILSLILASLFAVVGCARSQAWEDTHTLKLVLGGNGIDVVNTLTLMLENNTEGGTSWTLPAANVAGVLTNDGTGILSWGSVSGITLKHNDTVNTIQTLLDLASSDNITVRENAGHITFTGALVQGSAGINVTSAYSTLLDRTVYTIFDTATPGVSVYDVSADLSNWLRLREHGDTVSAELSASPAQGSVIMGKADGTSEWGTLLAGTAIALDKTVDGQITISGSRDTLQTNGVDNGRQSKLNLAAGTNVTLTDNGTGTVTIASTAVAPTLKTNGTNNGSQTTLNLAAGTDITLTDNGTGTVTIDASGATNAVTLLPTTTGRNLIKSPNRVKGLQIRNAGSQTADLFEVGDSLGTNWFAVGSGGGVNITVPLNIQNTVDAHVNLIRNVANGIASADAVNLSQLTSAVSAVNPLTTAGDMLYENSTPVAARLAIGSTGNVLTVSGGLPVWAAPASSFTVPQIITLSGITHPTAGLTLQNFTSNGPSPALKLIGMVANGGVQDTLEWAIDNNAGVLTFSSPIFGTLHGLPVNTAMTLPFGGFGGANFVTFPATGSYWLNGIKGVNGNGGGQGWNYTVGDGSGTNSGANDIWLSGGAGTGSANGGSTIIQASYGILSGTTVRGKETIGAFIPTGNANTAKVSTLTVGRAANVSGVVDICTMSSASATIGTATLVAGTVTVSTTNVSSTKSIIFLTHQTVAGTQGILSVGTITNATSFVINSSNAADTGTVGWWVIQKD